MRRVAIAGVVVLALLVLAALAVRQSLRQGPLLAAVEERLSEALGQPVTIGDLSVSFVPRVALTGREVRVGEASEQAPALDIQRIRILPRTGTLFSGRVGIEEVQLDGLTVSVLRDADGQWHVPAAVPAPATTGDGRISIERVGVVNGRVLVFDGEPGNAPGETGAIDDITAHVTIEEGGLRLSDVTARIGGAQIAGEARTDASAVRMALTADAIEDRDLPQLLRLAGSDRPEFLRLQAPASLTADLRVDRSSLRFSGEGKLSAPQVALDPLRLERFEAPFAIQDNQLSFKPATFALYGGTHQGTLLVHFGRGVPRWTMESRVRELDIAAFLIALTGRDQRVDGRADVTASLQGRIDAALDQTVGGQLELLVTNGVLREFPLVAAVNNALRLADTEGRDTRFERLSGTFTLGGARATTSNLRVDAGHVNVRAGGVIGFDRTLALRGTAAISAERVAEAAARVRELARLRSPGGEIRLPLSISGTADAPSFDIDLMTAIKEGVGDELKRRLRDLFKRPDGGVP
jgi:uncharacterized protein involved in outer membrane biogenesis